MPPILIFLPGLDGSGTLFSSVLAELGTEFTYRVLPLPTEGKQTAEALAAQLIRELPEAPFILIAESFAGALAVHLVEQKPKSMVGLILVATFLRAPRPWLLRLPASLFRIGWWLRRPLAPLWWPLCGYRHHVALRTQLLTVLDQLSWSVLAARLQAIRQLDRQPTSLGCPVVVFHAGDDRLLPQTMRPLLDTLGSHHVVKGPHFLLQSAPVEMAERIREHSRAFAVLAGLRQQDSTVV